MTIYLLTTNNNTSQIKKILNSHLKYKNQLMNIVQNTIHLKKVMNLIYIKHHLLQILINLNTHLVILRQLQHYLKIIFIIVKCLQINKIINNPNLFTPHTKKYKIKIDLIRILIILVILILNLLINNSNLIIIIFTVVFLHIDLLNLINLVTLLKI